MAAEVYLKVTPEQLLSMSQRVNSKLTRVKSAFSELEQIMNGTMNIWEGEGGDAFRRQHAKEKENLNKVLNLLSDEVADLTTIGEIYQKTEKTNVNTSTSLPLDVIE